MTLPDWWSYRPSRPAPKKRTPMKPRPRPKRPKTPVKPLPKNAVVTRGGSKVNHPSQGLYPVQPAAAKFATAPKKPKVPR